MALISPTYLLLFFVFGIGILNPLVANSEESSEHIVQRIHAHLLIHDTQPAIEEARKGIFTFPQNKLMWISYLNALAQGGEDKEINYAWSTFLTHFPEEKNNHKLLENRAWSIVHKGFASHSPITRSLALLAAFLSQDARGVDLIEKALADSNILLRGMSVKLASQLKDSQLQAKIHTLMRTEKNWKIRLQLIEAVGNMHIIEAKDELLQLLQNSHSSVEEQVVAIAALVKMSDTAQKEDLHKLIYSQHAGMRQLACAIIVHCQLGEYADMLIPLLGDYHASVRAATLNALGVLDFPNAIAIQINKVFDQKLPKLLNDHDPLVAITATWLLTLKNPTEGQQAFQKWLVDKDDQIRSLAAAALVATGKYGFTATLNAFYSATDPFVRMNLAFGLVNQRTDTSQACAVLADGLSGENKKLMWKEIGTFRYLSISTLKYNDLLPQYPETINQHTRLEIINILALLKSPVAQHAMIAFLEQKTWGISGLASALLLTEGDQASLQLILPLLKHPSDKIRIQAALILASWGREEAPIEVLLNSYKTADRDLKEKILEGLARIGAPSTWPFLINQLENPSQSLRILAASALLQSLYH